MKRRGYFQAAVLLGGWVALALPAAAGLAGNPLAWPAITAQNQPWTWWWWHGSAVDETNLTRELKEFQAAGLGGVQITTIYGVKGMEERDIPYLTPAWLRQMGQVVKEAGQLGMGVDMSLGSGWCFGGPTVDSQDANAQMVARQFPVAAGQNFQFRFDRSTLQALMAFGPEAKSLDLLPTLAADGRLSFSAPADAGAGGGWTIYAISQKPSGQKVKRAAPGGEGWMLNPAYPAAVTRWLGWFDAALAGYGGPLPQAVFQDSYEYRTDWAPDFFARFQRMRGYALQEHLPALLGAGGDEQVSRVKYDYRRTISEIMAGAAEPAWIGWARARGMSTIYQAHGTPGNWLDLYGDADMPETEMFHNDRSVLISKFASSAAHTQGRPLVGAETGTWLKEHFTTTLADLKQLADDMFLAGVNHIYYHGTCYSPADAAWPGWLFYAATEMNPRNPIWHDVPALNHYVARCQSLLQGGAPDNDALLYWPVADYWSDPRGLLQPMTVSQTRWFEGQSVGRAAHMLWDSGRTFDYVSDAQLSRAAVAAGRVKMPGADYQAIVVPACRYIPLATLEALVTLMQSGATVLFAGDPAATLEPAGLATAAEQQRFQQLRRQLGPGAADAPHRVSRLPFGQGWLVAGGAFGPEELQAAGLEPETMVQDGLALVRNRFDGGWTYFMVNRGAKPVDDWVKLGRPAASVAIFDPLTDKTGMAARSVSGKVHVQLAAGGSLILRAWAAPVAGVQAWAYWDSAGAAQEIDGSWNLSFIAGGPALPAASRLAKPASWLTLPDPAVQAFAGTARYETVFDAPAADVGRSCYLDLGDVRQSARVELNGKNYGALITPPFRVRVDNLQTAGNRLTVEVTSVAANRIRDLDRRGVDWKIFKEINFVDENYHPFNAANWPLTAGGLLGPVTIMPLREAGGAPPEETL